MKKLSRVLTIYCILLSPAVIAETVHIATPVWEGYTEENGTGLYHELLKAVFETENIDLKFTYAPFNRCQKLVLEGSADAVPAAYYEPERGTTYPTWHMGTDYLSVLYNESSVGDWKGQASLEGKTVGWVRGYKLDEFGIVTANIDKYVVNSVESGLKMLERGRIDILIDYDTEITPIAESIDLNLEKFNFDNYLPGLKLYLEFGTSERSKQLSQLYDKGMKRLYNEGRLEAWLGDDYERPALAIN